MNARSRKNRSSSARGGRGKGVERQVLADGVYTNHRFMQSVGALVGLPVLIQTKTNEIIEGVFTTFSPNFDLVLDMAHPVSRSDPSVINPETIKRKMIFSASDIVTIKVSNVDLEYATKEGFAVDQVISRFNGQVTERPLEPWQGDANAEDNLALGEESSNGWDVDDMFRKNEEKYGVQTSYTPEMEGYTTPLNRRNTREYREREAKASKIAAEIMSAPTTQVRSEAENGDEEDKYSAVIRPADQAATGAGGGGASKYVPPMMRKRNPNSGKLMRSTPPPGPGGRYGGSNPTTPTSPSCTGPPQVSSGSHSPIGGPSGPGGASPGYPPQQAPPQSTHSPSPTTHPPLHRHNSHSHPSDSKVNGDAKGSYDRRNHDGPMNDQRENHHNDNCNKQEQHHSRQHHGEGPPQKGQQKPPPSQHQHPPTQHTGHMPPMGQGDHRKQEPREQREPRKQRTNKEEQIADLKKFSQDFKLSEQAEKKAQQNQQQHHHPPTPQQMQQQQPQEVQQQQPPPQQVQQHPSQPQQHPSQQQQQQQQQRQAPPPQQQPPPQPPPSQPQQQPPPQPQQPPPQPQQQPPQQQQPQSQQHMPPQQQPQQRQTPPVSTPMPQGPPHPVSQGALHPQNPPAMTMSPVAEVSKVHEEVDKISNAVSTSKLNPNAKEFVFNPNAKPFSPRSPSTTTPPRPHTPQTPQIPANQPPQMTGGPPVNYQQAMVSTAYVMASPPFAVQQQPPRFPKRGWNGEPESAVLEHSRFTATRRKYYNNPNATIPIGSGQRPEYTSQMQVAAATGQPILAPAPMNTQPQAITAVQIPQNILPQTPQPYQYPAGVPMMVRFPPSGMQMVTAMVPTSMGLYSQAADSQQQSQQHGHQTMYMGPASLPPHQPHPPHTPGPGPQPTQPPTPQNPGGGGGPPNMPNQPPTPGPTPPQALMYSHMSGQPSLPQHLPHSPHTAQSPHAHPYPGQNAAAAGHHGGPGQQMAAQIVMLPPNMAAGPHMMHHSGPPPHSAAAHIPSSMAGFTPTSSAGVQHMPSAPHIQYIQSKQSRYPH